MTPISVIGKGTDRLLSISVKQFYKKQKHYSGKYAPEQRPIEGWCHFLLSRTLDVGTQFYHGLFNNDRYNTPQDAVVALYRNETYNYGITYILSSEGVLLYKNFTLSPKNKANLTFVAGYFQTAYNFIKL